MEALGAIQERLRNHDTRLTANHDSLAYLRNAQAAQGTEIAVIHTELAGISEDFVELKNDMKWIKRGLFGAIAVGLMFTVAVATLVVQVA